MITIAQKALKLVHQHHQFLPRWVASRQIRVKGAGIAIGQGVVFKQFTQHQTAKALWGMGHSILRIHQRQPVMLWVWQPLGGLVFHLPQQRRAPDAALTHNRNALRLGGPQTRENALQRVLTPNKQTRVGDHATAGKGIARIRLGKIWRIGAGWGHKSPCIL